MAPYPPLDVLKLVHRDVWVVDSGPIKVWGLKLPVRMTVLRLSGGDLWLHSPTRPTNELRIQLEAEGRIRHLVAPDIAHWSFLPEWQQTYPGAVVWATPGLLERKQVRTSGLRIDRVLPEVPPPEWAGELDQVTILGIGFSEVDFFHRSSRTLIMTDLVQNLETSLLPAWQRVVAHLIGVAAPSGRAPIYLRLSVSAKKREAARAAAQMVRWNPERVIFSHGRWFERDGTASLQRSLDWLLPNRG
jgi:hypothetical protein